MVARASSSRHHLCSFIHRDSNNRAKSKGIGQSVIRSAWREPTGEGQSDFSSRRDESGRRDIRHVRSSCVG